MKTFLNRFFICTALATLGILNTTNATQSPRVSIVTTIYKGDEFIQPFLEDIAQQTIFNECECIIVNANSPGNEDAIIQKFVSQHPNTRYIKRNVNNGRYEALNYAIEQATGDYIYMASLDNRIKENTLEVFADELDADPDVDLVYSGYMITKNPNETFNDNTQVWHVDPPDFAPHLLSQCISGPQPMWRKSLHDVCGYFDADYLYVGNWEMWNRAVQNDMVFKKIPGYYTLYYFNPNGITTTEDEAIRTRRDKENQQIVDTYCTQWHKPLFLSPPTNTADKSFVVIIPSYNNKQWLPANLDSVRLQNYSNYRVIYIDDASPDGTGDLVEEYITRNNLEKTWTLIKNKKRKGILANHYTALCQCKPEEIAVTLDGDDWFAHNHVLSHLNTTYQDPNVWLTYGQFAVFPGNSKGCAAELPEDIVANNEVRIYQRWVTSQLRTFYADLFHQIKKEDLSYEGDEFYPMAGDVALMMPMLEMAGKHAKFIDEVLYIYNRANPINDDKINRSLQIKCDRTIRQQKKYEPLKQLPHRLKKKAPVTKKKESLKKKKEEEPKKEVKTTTGFDQKPMVVVIPSYNNSKWYEKNLDSVFNQKYDNYRVIYIDDASPDGTGNLVQDYVIKHGLQDKVTIIKNEKRKGALENLYNAIHTCKSTDIIVDLDGDDWFAHMDVLSYLNNQYRDPLVWMTYGQFQFYPSGQKGFAQNIPPGTIERNAFRHTNFITSQLRTFYAGLFQQIKKEDLLYQGSFFPMAGDLAFMYPMFEMAGSHARFIPDVLYIYNIDNPINDHKVDGDLQAKLDRHIRAKEKYAPIEHYNHNKKTIYITPGQWGQLFALHDPYYDRDHCLQPLVDLKHHFERQGYRVKQADSLANLTDVEAIICFEIPEGNDLKEILKYPKNQRYLFLWEPPSTMPQCYDESIHQHFSRVYTWHDGLVDNKTYFKYYIPIMNPMIEHVVPFHKKKHAVMIACDKKSQHPDELYTQRKKVIEFYEKNDPENFDLFGRGWSPHEHPTFKGRIQFKVDILQNYKFCFCYENVKDIPGYVTEKIFDCLQAACVPIYLGANNITDYVPKECFIDRRDFASMEDLYEYLVTMDGTTYQKYIDAMSAYLKTEKAHRFTSGYLTKTFQTLIEEKRQPYYFVTATDQKYFTELINLIGGIHKNNFDQLGEIMVYDLGLTKEQKKQLETIEKVKLYQIELVNPDLITPFATTISGQKKVPGWYAWKAVAIKQALDIYPEVLFIDAGTTVYRPLDDLFDHIHTNGYFFHNASNWCIDQESTNYVKEKFNLYAPENKWILDKQTLGLESGLMGLTHTHYHDFVVPMYNLSKDLQNYVDDGTAGAGFGCSRHDQTLFSIYALQNHMHIYHHYEDLNDFHLQTSNGAKPFHIACVPWTVKDGTHIYCSRMLHNVDYFKQFIHWKK